MNIKINHVAKMEGHAGFMASVVKGDVKSARLEVKEGIRLIEGVLVGRHFTDVPVVAQRICGICPVVHNLTSIKAVEDAFGIEVSEETKNLRRLLELGQIIHSHALHLFFLSLADFLDMDNDIELIKKYPEETKKAVKIREFGMKIVETIGGRVVHILTNEAGGFKKVPKNEDLQKIVDGVDEILNTALEMGEFFKKIKIPDFQRETEYIALSKKGEYAIYEGDISSSRDFHLPIREFENSFHEVQRKTEVVNRVEHDGESYMNGAIARINLNHEKLNPEANKYLEGLGFSLPDYNPFHNILYQMVEVIHAIEEARRILGRVLNSDLEKAISKPFKIKEGIGISAVEAPRGTLYYKLEIDSKGYVKNANIITPTAQCLPNLEDDIAEYIPTVMNLDEEAREKKLRAFIRAYDPCISCAVH